MPSTLRFVLLKVFISGNRNIKYKSSVEMIKGGWHQTQKWQRIQSHFAKAINKCTHQNILCPSAWLGIKWLTFQTFLLKQQEKINYILFWNNAEELNFLLFVCSCSDVWSGQHNKKKKGQNEGLSQQNENLASQIHQTGWIEIVQNCRLTVKTSRWMFEEVECKSTQTGN